MAAPNGLRDLGEQSQFRNLLIDVHDISADAAGKSALRAQGQLIQGHIFGSFFDALDQMIFALYIYQ
jgi:hypothetical protein